MLERTQDRSWLHSLNTDAGCRLSGAQKALAQWAIVDDYHTVLDLSCRDTQLLRYFLHRFQLRACGIAADPQQAHALQEEAAEAEIICARKEDIPWHSDSFDAVFYQLRKADGFDGAFLNETKRVMKAGGQLLIALQGMPEGLRKAAAAVGIDGEESNLAPHTLLQSMEKAGFADVSYRMARPFVGVAIGWKRE